LGGDDDGIEAVLAGHVLHPHAVRFAGDRCTGQASRTSTVQRAFIAST
jgi:hypothetical protein